MTDARTVVLSLLLVAAVGFGLRGLAPPSAQSGDPTLPEISAAQRSAGLTYDSSVGPAERRAVDAAIAGARPEAQRLIGLVDGLVTIRIGPAGGSALGVTSGGGEMKGYVVLLDLDSVISQSGTRGVSRLVLHELGHVIDHALLTEQVQAAARRRHPDRRRVRGGSCRRVCRA